MADNAVSMVTYIWIDGAKPTKTLRSKVRVIAKPEGRITPDSFPEWGYDGSSTYQATGDKSDLILKPIHYVPDPITAGDNYLVLCEVYKADGTPHETNSRAKLREIMDKGASNHEPWIGFEQEFTLFKGRNPLGWPDGGYPAPQGPFYCGVGADEAFGRPLIDHHTLACMKAGIMIYGTNAEVMPGQWEYQIGYRGINSESPDPLNVSDQLWIARWLLYRLGEDFGISVTLHPKPIKGDWNGAGKHTNFSTKEMRDPKKGRATIDLIIERLKARHADHILVYGAENAHRLTGSHETAPITEFSWGVSHRGASVRIPQAVAENGYGYIEDRRPAANADPYEVSAVLLKTACDLWDK